MTKEEDAAKGYGLTCPVCGCPDTSVDWTDNGRRGRVVINGKPAIARYRHCNNDRCKARFRTAETVVNMVKPQAPRAVNESEL